MPLLEYTVERPAMSLASAVRQSGSKQRASAVAPADEQPDLCFIVWCFIAGWNSNQLPG